MSDSEIEEPIQIDDYRTIPDLVAKQEDLLPKQPNLNTKIFLNSVNLKKSNSIVQAYMKLTLSHGSLEHLKTNLLWLSDRLAENTSNLNTLAKRFTVIKNNLKKRFPEQKRLISSTIGLRGSQGNDRKKIAEKSKRNRLTIRVEVKLSLVKSVVQKLIESYKQNQIDAIILAELSSGRRLLGILREASFKQSVKPGYITVTRTSKQKDEKRKPFDVPLLDLTFETFEMVLDAARKGIPDAKTLDNASISNRFSRRVNARVKELFKNEEGSHFLRKVYGQRSILDHKPSIQSDIVFLNNILGHSKNSLDSGLNYQTVRLINDTGDSEQKLDSDIEQKQPDNIETSLDFMSVMVSLAQVERDLELKNQSTSVANIASRSLQPRKLVRQYKKFKELPLESLLTLVST